MEPHTGGWPIAVYPPLPPPTPDDMMMLRETTTRTAVRQGGHGEDTRQRVEALAQHSAAVHQMTADQLGHVQRQQDHLATKTTEYLRAQQEQQAALQQQQDDMRKQMDEHRAFIAEQYRLLKAAQEAVGLQGQRLESLAEAVRPQVEARWGNFARSADTESAAGPQAAPVVTVAAGTNLPTPPIYRGSSKKEKREFMDSYMIYERRVRALNQGSQAKIFVMPLSACIEQSTMIRICDTEVFKSEREMTEAEWRSYFLSARQPDHTAYKKLEAAMASLRMDTELQDAESRVSRLMASFYAILNKLNMEDVLQRDPKKVVSYLVEALRPPVFKAAVKDELEQSAHKQTRANLRLFLQWLRPKMDNFMTFEPHINSQAAGKPPTRSNLPTSTPTQSRGGFTKPVSTAKSSPASSGHARGAADPGSGNGGGVRRDKSIDRACFKCGDVAHGVFQCPSISGNAEAKELYEKHTGKKVIKPVASLASTSRTSSDVSPSIPCTVMGLIETAVTPDSGAEVTVVTPKLVKALKDRGVWLSSLDLDSVAAVTGIGAKPVPVKTKVKLDLKFSTPGGPLVLANVVCWVTAQQLPRGMGDLLLSRPVMERLGYNPERLLADAQRMQPTYDMGDLDEAVVHGVKSVLAYAGSTEMVQQTDEERNFEENEDLMCFPTSLTDDVTDREEIRQILMRKVDEAATLGASRAFVAQLKSILNDHIDVFRLTIGKDPPVDMPPMEVTLKPGAVPTRCRSRRYSEEQREFLREHVDELLAAGHCYRNPRSRWCSPPHIVKKPGSQKPRMTVDVRVPNENVEQVVWPMPILEVEFDRLRGSSYYFSLDFFKGFWQFAMADHCQEIYSILTEDGVVTPTRVLMGGTNSVAHVQSTVQEMFAEVFYKGLLIWIDDLLGYHRSEEGLLGLLVKVLEICAVKRLKLNPSKCDFFLREALWCGRMVSEYGVRHDPARIDALTSLPPPTTGQELQQFICAMNWMRMFIPAFNKLTAPLTELMERVYALAGGRKKNQVRKVFLEDASWSETEETCLDQCKSALAHALQLAHPDPQKRLCVFTDASDAHWGAAITQVSHDQAAKPLSEQNHEPLMMLSGSFSGAAQRWAIVEKEAFAIIETCRRADYLLHRPDGFVLFTDHRNLRYIFNPHGVSSAVPKYTADKLHRWALLLMAYRYEIHDIAGDDNVWADLLSRWGSSFKTVCAISQLRMPLSPQLDREFVWPSLVEIATVQSAAGRPTKLVQSDVDAVWRDDKGKVWIPDDASSLQLRICVVGHFGAAGHRSTETTLAAIKERFIWKDLDQDVIFFVRRCLHCASTIGGPPQPRPLGEALHADRPNEVIHWDYLFMGKSDSDLTYVLVIKDDASKFVWLLPCDAANAENTYNHLIDWFASFGVCRTWVSDQGTHFKNKVIEALQHALGAHHHFTTARCPWANGTVEVVMREVLRCCRALLSEWRLPPRDWPRVIKVVQMILNQSPSKSMGGVAPITAMTGLRAMSPLDQLAVPGPIGSTTWEEIQVKQRENIAKLQAAMDNMHRRTAKAASGARAAGRTSRDNKRGTSMAQFDIGDFVLYADVWAHARDKLKVKWCGPAQVTAATSNWVFEIQNMITGERKEAHASRLKFYADSTLEINEELLLHVAHNSEGHVVHSLLDARYSAKEKRHELRVHWRGLDTAEDSWEPADVLLQDVPAAVKAFVRAHGRRQPVKALGKALGIN